MESFAFEAPQSLDAALALLGDPQRAGRKQVLAGGTDMIVQLKSRDPEPRLIVDIKRIPETQQMELTADGWLLGAAVPGAAITARADIAARYPGLVEATDLIGSSQIQGRATVGGNLCNASPAGDTIPALIANSAVCLIAGPQGRREVPVEAFVTGVGQNQLADGEFLVALRVPDPGPRSGDAYLRFIPRTEMDIAVAGAGVRVTLDEQGVCTDARVAIGAVAPTPLLVPGAATALIGTQIDEAAVQAAGAACTAAAQPISDKRGTADYRRTVVGVLARRAIAIARQRAQGGQS